MIEMIKISEIEPALRDPQFDPRKCILVLDLPMLGARDCRCVTPDLALEILQDLGNVSDVDTDKWRDLISRAASEGRTAVVKLWADTEAAHISVHGLRIEAAAKA